MNRFFELSNGGGGRKKEGETKGSGEAEVGEKKGIIALYTLEGSEAWAMNTKERRL